MCKLFLTSAKCECELKLIFFFISFNSSELSVKVGVLPKLKPKDFVLFANAKKECQVLQILDIIKQTVHGKLYLEPKNLPRELDLHDSMGKTIQFKRNEVIEDGTRSENISIKQVLSKCKMNFLPELEGDRAMYGDISSTMYVCRYKLIRETIYKLKPVGWRRADDSDAHYLTDEEESSVGYESSASKFSDIDEHIGRLHLNSNKKRESVQNQLVSPIKIVKNSVQKVSRNKTEGENEPNSIEQLSPSKRAKHTDELNSNYLMESPVSAPQRKSHRGENSVKKNLNSSFVDVLNDTIDEEEQNYNIIERIDSDKSMKLTLRKATRNGPLKELNENASNATVNQIPDKILNKNVLNVQEMSTPTTRRKSILKQPGSETSKPFKPFYLLQYFHLFLANFLSRNTKTKHHNSRPDITANRV